MAFLTSCYFCLYPQKTNFDANRMTNPVQESNRMEKIQKYQDKKRLETLLEEMEKRTHVEEEVSFTIHIVTRYIGL